MMKSIAIGTLGFTSPIEVGFTRLRRIVAPNSGKPELGGRGRIWREAANPGEGLRSLERPYPLTPALSPWERESTPATLLGGRE
jgi:hypothetical protein